MAGFEDDEPTPNWSVRSTIKYPDLDPEGTAAMWARLRAQRNASHTVEEGESDYDFIITQPAEEFDDPIGPLAQYVKLVHQNGWNIHKLAHSRAFAKGKPFKSGANEGNVRPDQNIEQQWLFAEKPGIGRIIVGYEIVNDVPRGTGTVRRFNGTRPSDRDLKNIIKGVGL